MNCLLTISSFLFPIISYPYVSRILSPDGIGKVSFATSVIAYFNIFAQLGVPVYGVRACAKVRDDKLSLSRVVQELWLLNIITSSLCYLGLFILIMFSSRIKEEWPLFVIMSTSIFLNALGMEWLYKALEQYTYISIRSILFKGISLLLMILLIHDHDDYVLYGVLTILAASASNILNFFYARHFVSIIPIKECHVFRHVKMVGIFFAMACAINIYTNLDTLMLGVIKSDYFVRSCYIAEKFLLC